MFKNLKIKIYLKVITALATANAGQAGSRINKLNLGAGQN